MKSALVMLLLCTALGCSSKPPAPKPSNQVRQLSPEEMKKAIADAEAKQPCSEQNLKNASAEQKQKCTQGQHMFDGTRPAQPAKQPASPPKR